MELQKIIRVITIGISILYLSTSVSADVIVNNNVTSKISGGYRAPPGRFPWMAVLYWINYDRIHDLCGGSILTERWILTAGHCIANRQQHFLVVLGDTQKSNIEVKGGVVYYRGPGEAMTTSTTVLHPHYGTITNDIALLYLPKDIQFGPNIQQVAIAGSHHRESFSGEMATVSGWGDTGRGPSRSLKWTQIPIIDNYNCARHWPQVTDNEICTAGRTGTDACGGDSGGPLMISDGDGLMQIGIVSYGDEYCPSSRPGVFTRVPAYAEWILRMVGQKI